MQRHLKVKPARNSKGPFKSEDVRNDWQTPGPTGPKTKKRAADMRRPPFLPADQHRQEQ